MILLRNSLGIYWLAFGVFIMATAEIVVSGILAMISEDLKVSVGMAGQLVTVYALVIAIGSPVLMAITARIERKRLLILSFLTFIIGNGIGYLSPDFSILVIARIVQAASASVFTVVALTMGSNLAAPGRQGTAIGTILMGAGTALAVGVPLGTLIGGHWGWRFVFVFIIMLGLLSVIGIAYTVPISKHQESLSLKQQLGVLRNRRIVSGLLITLFWVTGYQMMFTYITPFLQETANLDATRISAALFVSGIFAIAGSRIGGFGSDRWGIFRMLMVSLLFHAAALIVFPWAATTFIGAIMILAIWIGFATMTTPVQQYYLISLSPESSGLALGMNNSIFQLGMAVGAATGGWIVQQTSVMDLGFYGAMSIMLGVGSVLYSFAIKKQPKTTRG